MQSHLEAALLGHGNNNSTSANPEEEDKDFQEEEGEDVDEFLDEVFFIITLFYLICLVSL